MRCSPAVLLLALAACSGTERVHVRALVPGIDGRPVPAPGVAVAALPYDRDSLLRALEAKAASPRPSTALVDSLFARFRVPFAELARADAEVRALADSQQALDALLAGVSRASDEYRARAAAIESVAAARASAERRRDTAQAALDVARRAFGPASDSARRALNGWEDSTYRDYEQATEWLVRGSGVRPATDTTRADGGVTLALPSGRWWIYARAWDALDPNAEWYWNIPVQGDTIVLSPENATRRLRY